MVECARLSGNVDVSHDIDDSTHVNEGISVKITATNLSQLTGRKIVGITKEGKNIKKMVFTLGAGSSSSKTTNIPVDSGGKKKIITNAGVKEVEVRAPDINVRYKIPKGNKVNTEFNVEVVMENSGDGKGKVNKSVRANGDIIGEVNTTVPPKSTKTKSFTVNMGEEPVGISVGGTTAVVQDWRPDINLRYNVNKNVIANKESIVEIFVENKGNAVGTKDVVVERGGAGVAKHTVTVEGNQTKKIEQGVLIPEGTHTISVNGIEKKVTGVRESFDISIQAPDKVNVGESFSAKVTAKNTGEVPVTIRPPISIPQVDSNSMEFKLGVGESKTKEINITAGSGNISINVGTETKLVDVLNPNISSSLTVDRSVKFGNELNGKAVAVNLGQSEPTVELSIKKGGKVVHNESVNLPTGARKEIRFSTKADKENISVSFAGERRKITVTDLPKNKEKKKTDRAADGEKEKGKKKKGSGKEEKKQKEKQGISKKAVALAGGAVATLIAVSGRGGKNE